MAKRHLKRHACPNTWKLERKAEKFVVRPRPGGHSMATGMSITSILKGLGFCETTKEVKQALAESIVQVNGRIVKDFKRIVGFMDVLGAPKEGLYFRMSIDERGKLVMIEESKTNANLLPCRVRGLCLIKGAITQVNCYNGYNLEMKEKPKIGDTVVLNLNTGATEVLPAKEQAMVLLIGGRRAGSIGTIVKHNGATAQVKMGDETHMSDAKHLFVVGGKKPVVKIR